MTATRIFLMSSVCALALTGCSGSATFGNSEIPTQEYGGAPNDTLAHFFADSADGEEIGVFQHTGSAELTVDAALSAEFGSLVADWIDGTITTEEFEAGVAAITVDPGQVMLAATADAADLNPATLEQGDPPTLTVESVGTLPLDEANAVISDGVALLPFVDPVNGDAVIAAVATVPGEPTPALGGGTFNYMSLAGWLAITSDGVVESSDSMTVALDFGIGHLGLLTPEEDMPVGGSASYSGPFVGVLMDPGASGDLASNGVGFATGMASLSVNFPGAFDDGLPDVEGSITGIEIVGVELDLATDFSGSFNDVALLADTITGNRYSGTATAVATEGATLSFAAGSSGPLDGAFYGPVVGDFLEAGPVETGAVLTIQDSGSDAFLTGAIGATID